MVISRAVWKLFKVFNKIKSATCNHYYIYIGTSKSLIIRRTRHNIECLDCKKIRKFNDLENANLTIEVSQKVHGSNYRKLRNGLMEGDIDVSKLDV